MAVWEQMCRDWRSEWSVWWSMGDVMARAGRYDEAKENYRRAFDLQPAPKYVDSLESIAQVCELAGDIPGAVAALEKQRSACVAVRTRDGLRLARLDEIMYAELAGRAVRYHLSDGTALDSVTVRGGFQEETAPLLADDRFLLCGASFVVNLFYVIAVEKGALRMDGGSRVPLPRGLAARVRSRWSSYWLGTLEGGAP